jgi:hypothetical protein
MHNGSVSSEASEASNGNTSDGSPAYMSTQQEQVTRQAEMGGGQGWAC